MTLKFDKKENKRNQHNLFITRKTVLNSEARPVLHYPATETLELLQNSRDVKNIVVNFSS
jgi:hypothetical protein